jgi:tRNA(fMet)-specific endonuclease VapC
MIHLLDTNTFTAIIKGHPQALAAFAKLDIQQIKLSVINFGEIEYGLKLNPVGNLKLARIQALLEDVEVLALDKQVAAIYGQIRADLQKRGEPIGSNDFWIAAHAISLGATLVTNNVREFKRIKGLKVENWLT